MTANQAKEKNPGNNQANLSNVNNKTPQPDGAEPTHPDPSVREKGKNMLQQPHLIQSLKKKEIDISLPFKSFFIALITVAITILLGIAIALFLKKITSYKPTRQRTSFSSQKNDNRSDLLQAEPTTENKSRFNQLPPEKENNFENLLDSQNSQ